MTRREAREHCFKMLFSADFYPDREEAKEQLAQYADGPEEDETDEEGHLTVLHKADLSTEDAESLEKRVSAIMDRIPEIDSQIRQGNRRLENPSYGKSRAYYFAAGALRNELGRFYSG